MSTVKFIRGTQTEIANTAISDGQILFETDQGTLNKIFADLANGTRVQIGGNNTTTITTTDVVYGSTGQNVGQYDESSQMWDDADFDGGVAYCKVGRVVFVNIKVNVRSNATYSTNVGKIAMELMPPYAPYKDSNINDYVYDLKVSADVCKVGDITSNYFSLKDHQCKIEDIDVGSGTMCWIVPYCQVFEPVQYTSNSYVQNCTSQTSIKPFYDNSNEDNPYTEYTITGWYICEADE